MLDKTEFNSSNRQKYHLSVIFLAYAVFTLVFGLAYRYAMNPDGTSVLRLAGYIAEGNFSQSVSSGYSPLFTWMVSGFMALGLEGLNAARAALALCGAGLVYSFWLLSLRFDLPHHIRFAAVLTATPLIAFWTIQFISPDVLFTSLVILYLFRSTAPGILEKVSAPLLCGVTAGFSYLAHHYTLPFFLVHFPVMLLLKAYMNKEREGLPWKKIMTAWAAGVMGFLVIASVWIGIVSTKYGELIVSPKGGIAHAIMGPDDKDRRHPFFVGGLFNPRDDHAIHVFEDISDVKFESWSPFENMEYFIHQLRIIQRNAVSIRDHFITKSPFFNRTLVILILALIPICIWIVPQTERDKYIYAWFVVTFCIYSSGFVLLIARSPRRFYALMLVFVLLSFRFVYGLSKVLMQHLSGIRRIAAVILLSFILIGAFTIKPALNVLRSAQHIASVDQANPYKELAEQIGRVDFPGPYAIVRTSQKPTTDYYITYFLNKQLLGRPASKDIQGITEELISAGGRSLVVFDDPDLVNEMMLDNRYVRLASIKLDGIKGRDTAAGWVVTDHEIINGWDETVTVFSLKQ